MEIGIGIIGLVITLLSFGFGLIQWRDNLKSKELYNQNIRKLWDMSRSYSPYRINTDKLKKKTDDKNIISFIEMSHTNFSTMFRELTPMYVQSIKGSLSYEFILSMIGNGEIGSSWALRLVLIQIDPKKRDKKKDKTCYEYLKESEQYLNDVKGIMNQKHSELKENIKTFTQ